MDEKSIAGMLSQLIPDSIENSLGLGNASPGKPDNRLVESLKAIAGQAGGSIEPALNEFLSGKGELHEATRAAALRGGTSSAAEIASLLITRFNLAPALASLVAPLLVNLLPALGQSAGGAATATPKPRRKAKPKASSSARPKAKASTRPKASVSRPAAKKKPAAKPAKKESASTAKPKKSKRTASPKK